MTYFQLLDSLQSPGPAAWGGDRERPVPSSSFLLNPTLYDPAAPTAAAPRPQLRPKLYLVPRPKVA